MADIKILDSKDFKGMKQLAVIHENKTYMVTIDINKMDVFDIADELEDLAHFIRRSDD